MLKIKYYNALSLNNIYRSTKNAIEAINDLISKSMNVQASSIRKPSVILSLKIPTHKVNTTP